MKQEIKLIRRIERYHESMVYPGYPFLIHGYVDMGEKVGSINLSNPMTLEKFCKEFDAKMCYQMVNSQMSVKGNWLVNTQMAESKRFLNAEYDDFYIDCLGATRLYFALYSAIRELKKNDSKAIIYFGYDDNTEWTWVEVFNSMDNIKSFVHEYYNNFKD